MNIHTYKSASGNKTEKKDKNIVIKRAKELGKALGKNFI